VLLASIYPALQFISYKPVQVLRGKLSFGLSAGLLRKILVVTQFTFSVILIIGTIVISRQLEYIRHKELGYDRSYVFSFGLGDMSSNFSAVKNELLREPSILGVSGANQDIIDIQSTTGDVDWDGKLPGSSFLIHPFPIDTAFFPMFRIQLKEGRPFTGSAADSGHYILNETAIRQAGITDPIGKAFSLRNKRGTIIGVAKDMHISSLKNKIEPAVFVYRNRFGMAYVKTNKGAASEAIRAVHTQWKKYNGGFPFTYTFLDEHFNSLYASDQRTATLFDSFAIVAILISCLGLLGLVTYSMQVRRKEIAIRKTLGAGAPRIMALVSRQFVGLITLSLLLAAPIAWWLMSRWLQDFAYHIEMQWWIILAAGLIALIITFLTIGIQILRASIAPPATNLRSE
jgi:putative ABC transport system permease protein